ncbi:MAG: PhzF family phenazine biosynthesis protein [Rubricoccaceae bacterium]
MSVPLTIVDAFAEQPFTGNPAAVCVLEEPAPEAWMQAVAGEMNLSETAFLVPTGDAFALRWFTPTLEVDLCGHATLASAHVLFETGALAEGTEARFDTKSGRLTVRQLETGELAMDFPATPPTIEGEVPDGFADIFGAEPVWFGRSRFDLFAELADEAAIHRLDPDHGAVAALGARGIILTARANASSPDDVVSRFFAPGSGVPEDPVTGSAHCAIGPYWAERLSLESVSCYQASRRGGHVQVHVHGDRVDLVGRAVTVVRGELATAPSSQGI